MRPIEFKEQTKVLQKPSDMLDSECKSLPIFNDGKMCISCWKMSFGERIRILFTGKLWLWVRSGKTQPPVKLTLNYPFNDEVK